MAAIRVSLPTHLKTLSHVDGEIVVEVNGAVTQRSVIDAVEAIYPMLCGTTRDHVTKKRRPFIRFYACGEIVERTVRCTVAGGRSEWRGDVSRCWRDGGGVGRGRSKRSFSRARYQAGAW